MYECYFKRAIDVVLSVLALLLGAVPMLLIALAVKGSSRGPVLFSQKRVGIHKTYFQIWKFRTMYTGTPANIPTHQLLGAERYLTPIGRVLRKTSLDELPQLFNILKGDMSIVGPRPALWNQYDLLAEREKYGANDIKPGLTGWAQVHGRDELEISKKARLDGVYARQQKKGGFKAFFLDCFCIALTVQAVWRRDGIVEGSREIKKGTIEQIQKEKTDAYKVLIAGAGSYIGMALERTLQKKPEQYEIMVLDMKKEAWREHSLEGYDSIVFVAGLAHRREKKRELAYYRSVNTLLPVELAKRAKQAGVRQFLFLSSMSVYGKQRGRITRKDIPKPNSYYGQTKWEAEQKLRKLEEEQKEYGTPFHVAVLRPPMVYGKGCKGNYPRLRKLALKTPLFPAYPNYRSMIYIGNLTAVLEQIIRTGEGGLYFPQNKEYVSTRQMVEEIAACHQKRILFSRWFHPFLRLLEQRVSLVQKVFGDLVYAQEMNVDDSWLPYQDFAETIQLTEHNHSRLI